MAEFSRIPALRPGVEPTPWIGGADSAVVRESAGPAASGARDVIRAAPAEIRRGEGAQCPKAHAVVPEIVPVGRSEHLGRQLIVGQILVGAPNVDQTSEVLGNEHVVGDGDTHAPQINLLITTTP